MFFFDEAGIDEIYCVRAPSRLCVCTAYIQAKIVSELWQIILNSRETGFL